MTGGTPAAGEAAGGPAIVGSSAGGPAIVSPAAASCPATSSPAASGEPRRVVVGITGASGTVYGVRLLQALAGTDIETHLVVSASGQVTRALETDWSKEDLEALADVVWRPTDMAAAISSGSFRTLGMVIAPCSMRTLGEIASGVTGSLVSRAADVVLKERRRLVLVTRESPLNLIHLRNMTTVTEAGAIVVPPVPGFYTRPSSVEEIVDQTVGRCLDLLGVEPGPGWERPRWGEGELAR